MRRKLSKRFDASFKQAVHCMLLLQKKIILFRMKSTEPEHSFEINDMFPSKLHQSLVLGSLVWLPLAIIIDLWRKSSFIGVSWQTRKASKQN